jgi:phosphotransferase system IIA component
MVQVGIGGERLGGEGYERHTRRGDTVSTGDPIVSWHPGELEALGVEPLVLVIAIERDEFSLSRVRSSGTIAVGDVAFVIPDQR